MDGWMDGWMKVGLCKMVGASSELGLDNLYIYICVFYFIYTSYTYSTFACKCVVYVPSYPEIQKP